MTSSSPQTNQQEWPQSSQFKRSIKLEFSLYISLAILILMAVTGYVFTTQYAGSVARSVVEKQLVQARSYARAAGKHILATDGPDALMLNDICKKLAEDDAGVFWVGITDVDRNFVAHTDLKQVITGAKAPIIANDDLYDLSLQGENVMIRHDTVFIATQIRENDHTLGSLAVTSSAESIGRARTSSILTVAGITLMVLLIGLPLTMLSLSRKLHPIAAITRSLKQVNPEELAFDIPFRGQNEFGYLAETLRVMGARLGEAQKHLVEQERMERELEIAQEIQANILPREYPKTAMFEFAGAYTSAKEVGGDYYDFIEIDDNHLAFLVADVSGKSLPGMLVMLMTRDIVRNLARTVPAPSQLVAQVNAELIANIKKGMFVTMFYGVLNKATGRFSFVSAGHNPLIKMSAAGEVEQLNPKGFPLGLMPPQTFDSRLQTATVSLNPGDWLIQYTDGVNEARSADDDEFGMERFEELLKNYRTTSPQDLVKSTLGKHREFVGQAPQFDDITLVALKWAGQEIDNRVSHVEESQLAR